LLLLSSRKERRRIDHGLAGQEKVSHQSQSNQTTHEHGKAIATRPKDAIACQTY